MVGGGADLGFKGNFPSGLTANVAFCCDISLFWLTMIQNNPSTQKTPNHKNSWSLGYEELSNI